MKKSFIISVIVFAIISIPSQNLKAQFNMSVVNVSEALKSEPIDDVILTVQYNLSFVGDTLHPEKKMDESMMLKIGKKNSVFYSYARFLTDSILEIDKKNGADMEVIHNHMKMFTAKVSYKIYKNHPAGQTTFIDQLAMNRFVCKEKAQLPEWTILDDTLTIHSYNCRKAVCNFYGRTYEAWFTPEIPRSEGPWKLQGLPGLILKAEDTEGHYKFECTGIVQNRGDEDKIMYSDDGCQPISRKELNNMYARFAADPIGYMTSAAPNVKVIMKTEDGRPASNPKNTPHNPIERE